MAASCNKILCCPLLGEKSTQTVKNVFLSRFSETQTVWRYLSTSKHMKRSNCYVHFLTNHNKLFCDNRSQQLRVRQQPRQPLPSLLQQVQPAWKCVQTSHTRPFSNESDGDSETKIKPIFVAIPNPFKLIRNKIYFWMIRSYFDPEFKAEDFTDGAKQAMCTISRCISDGNFDQLEGLLSRKLLDEVKETLNDLGMRDRANIVVNTDDVLHIFPQNVAVHYDESGGKFLNILMRFWCHSMSSEESDKGVVGMRIGRPPPGVSQEEFNNMGSVISCTYEFHRDFTPGVDPNWMVTYIQHGKWLNTEARWLPKEWSRD